MVVGYPATPIVEGRARICISAAHTREMLDKVCSCCIFYSCNIGMSDLPDMYAQSPRAMSIYVSQITSACVTAIM